MNDIKNGLDTDHKDYLWFKDEPETEERMIHTSRRYTPCEVLRQVYERIEDPETRRLLRVATTMTKSLAAKITRIEGRGWGQKVYPWNPKYLKKRRSKKEE